MWAGQYWNGLNQGRYGCFCFLDSGSVEFEVFKKFPAVCVSSRWGIGIMKACNGKKYAYVVHSDEQSFWLISIPVSLDWLLPRLSYNNQDTNGCIISQVKSLRCPNFGGSSETKCLERPRFVPSPKSAAASSPKGKVKVTSPASPASPWDKSAISWWMIWILDW